MLGKLLCELGDVFIRRSPQLAYGGLGKAVFAKHLHDLLPLFLHSNKQQIVHILVIGNGNQLAFAGGKVKLGSYRLEVERDGDHPQQQKAACRFRQVKRHI